MEENKKKKDWVKNAIIIFLVIMLILTFCSNTIMNISVPEVSSAYIQSGTIVETIRDTGYVEASDPYKAVASENRKISTVLVKDGDHVEMGDVIFGLEDSESTDVASLEEKIIDAELSYYSTLIDGTMLGSSSQKYTGSGTGSLEANIQKIKEYDDAIAAIEASLDTANSKVSTDKANQANADASIAYATEDKAEIESKYNAKKSSRAEEYAAELSKIEAEIASVTSEITALKGNITATTSDTDATARLEAVKTAVWAILTAINGDAAYTGEIISMDFIASDSISTLEDKYSMLIAKIPAGTAVDYASLKAAYESARTAYYNTIGSPSSLAALEARLAELNAKKSTYTVLQAKNNADSVSSNSDYKDALEKLSDANEIKASVTAALNGDQASYDKLKIQLDALKADREQLAKDLKGAYTADSYAQKLASMKEQLEKLKENAYDGSVTAPVAGTITNLKLVAGESITKDAEMFTIIPDGKGLELSISVNNEQAKKVRVGDVAELPWRYENVSAIVSSIAVDTESKGTKQTITFDITDEESVLTLGQSLSVSVGSKSQEYDLIVPKSAVKTDNGGDYVFKIEASSSPLGNKYTVTKVSVTKQASDDNNVAITGEGLSAYDYVVTQTTSSKILTDKQRVRLASGEGE